MLCFPNAKINLGLYVTEKRSDGFHNIESVFYPIPLCDSLEFIPTKKTPSTIKIHGIELDSPPEDNLVFKAYQILQKKHKLPPVEISLLKNIPVGAGLGGGSADGAFMLTALNDFFDLKLSDQQMEKYALELGSDCPFFIENKPKLVTGRGEIFNDIYVSLRHFSLLLVNPGIHISTKEAYSGIQPQKPIHDLKSTIEGNVFDWKTQLSNDFEKHILLAHPEIARLKKQMYDLGAVYASMSGSGSTVYGVFETLPTLPAFPERYFVFSKKLSA